MGIRRYVQLYNSIAAATGAWIMLDSRYEELSERALVITLTAGDTLTLQGTVRDVKNIDQTYMNNLNVEDIVSLKTYTQSGNDILKGNWRYLRVIKVGTAGVGTIEGFV